MQQYSVKQGNKLFWPVQARHLVPMRYTGYDFEFSLSESCWFEGGGGQRFQQNKALGITGAFSDNNSRAALISWQVTDVENVFLATGYTNFADKSWVHGKPGISAVHFSAEEKHMKKSDYHDFSAHKKEHSMLLAELTQLVLDIKNKNLAVNKSTLRKLRNWLVAHIMIADHDYAKYYLDKSAT